MLAVAPSTYYAAKNRPPSQRSITDAEVMKGIVRVHADSNDGTYGATKMWAQVNREGGVGGRRVARCTGERLMHAAGLHGVRKRVAGPRTTLPGNGPDTRADLVERTFTADAPMQFREQGEQCRVVSGHRALCPCREFPSPVSLTIARWPPYPITASKTRP